MYRGDIMAFVEFCGIAWPQDAARLLRVSIREVQARTAWRNTAGAPKTINRRISSLSCFYKFLSGAAVELRLPITVPNPAHAQFIAREASDAVVETRALSETRARQVISMPTGDSLIELRDRAILKFYLYTGASIETGCKLNVSDFHQYNGGLYVEAAVRTCVWSATRERLTTATQDGTSSAAVKMANFRVADHSKNGGNR